MKRQIRIYDRDPWLGNYRDVIERRAAKLVGKKKELAGDGRLSLAVNGAMYYCLHRENGKYMFREWAPNAGRIYLIGSFNGWRRSPEWALTSVGGGNWELAVDEGLISHGDLYKWYVEWPGGGGERLPAYAVRCVQDPETKIFSAQVWNPEKPYRWHRKRGPKIGNPIIYETHIGMCSEEQKVATFTEFRENVLPRIKEGGYNTIQIMALQEHPYYGSFGYQVSNFYALSSRFGTPEEFKALVDAAHQADIAVIMDVVHSHAVSNEVEGIGRLDGSYTTYFHEGARGTHPAWNSRCFDYGKNETVHFLLSNLKYWMQEYCLDGFRFDGVTSMLYYDHGLERDFTNYDCYFDGGQDEDAFVYLGLANILVKELNGRAFTIAEDMSGMPGLAAPVSEYGTGFDYRMSMGIADHWIKWIKEKSDWEWSMGEIYYELSNKRVEERTISYAECHDQALVGDKTIIFRLMDKEMYFSMNKESRNLVIDRGIALHKMIRLVTAATAGDGYLNFMGNEFGHPEWIDFPREGNGWSYFYARRQWSLADSDLLRYRDLLMFDKDMIRLFSENQIFGVAPSCVRADEEKKVLVLMRGEFIFALNFNPEHSFADYGFEVPAGEYVTVLDSDSFLYGGFGRNDSDARHITVSRDGHNELYLYLPCRSAQVMKKI